jgi:antitoxin MazE
MNTKIQKWGNGVGIRLPKVVFESGQFSLGSVVALNQKGSEIILKVVKQKIPSLKEIMKNISPEKFHSLVDFGLDVGKEIID